MTKGNVNIKLWDLCGTRNLAQYKTTQDKDIQLWTGWRMCPVMLSVVYFDDVAHSLEWELSFSWMAAFQADCPASISVLGPPQIINSFHSKIPPLVFWDHLKLSIVFTVRTLICLGWGRLKFKRSDLFEKMRNLEHKLHSLLPDPSSNTHGLHHKHKYQLPKVRTESSDCNGQVVPHYYFYQIISVVSQVLD